MTATEKAKFLIAHRSTTSLIEDFILTGSNNDPHIPTVRGWIMDELEHRNPNAFSAWLEQDVPTDESLRNYF